MKRITKILLILTLITTACNRSISFNAAPESYIIEAKENALLEPGFSYYYARSVVTGKYKLTVIWPDTLAYVGDTVRVNRYYDDLFIIHKN